MERFFKIFKILLIMVEQLNKHHHYYCFCSEIWLLLLVLTLFVIIINCNSMDCLLNFNIIKVPKFYKYAYVYSHFTCYHVINI